MGKKPYVQIEDDMPWNAKIRMVSPAARWAYVASICYCGHNLTDGFVAAQALSLVDGTRKTAAELVEAGLWEKADGGFVVHDYLKHNRSRAKVDAIRQVRAEAGINGHAARYGWQTEEQNAGKVVGKLPSKTAGKLPALTAVAVNPDPFSPLEEERSVAEVAAINAGKTAGNLPACRESEPGDFESEDVGFRERYMTLAIEFREVDASMARKFKLIAEDRTQEEIVWALNELSRQNVRPWPEKVTAILLERDRNETDPVAAEKERFLGSFEKLTKRSRQ